MVGLVNAAFRHRRPDLPFVLSAFAACAAGCQGKPASLVVPPAPVYYRVTHGTAVGDVTDSRAVLWARTDHYAAMHVRVEGDGHYQNASTWVSEAGDYDGKIVLENLAPGTEYHYLVWFSADDGRAPPPSALVSTGVFRTAPLPARDAKVTFGWSGDLGGLNVCRDVREGYPIFRHVDGRSLDFFIGLGDMIYGDQDCLAAGLYGNTQVPTPFGPSATLRSYWSHWKYNREDEGLRRLLRATGYYAVWDDHEVVNDFGPDNAWHAYPPYVAGVSLLPLGRRAFLDENPILEDRGDERLYRSFRWGKHLELVLLDTRSYRDPNRASDRAERPKTMLGSEQRAWFERAITQSDATWKVVVSSVPISIPTGRGGADGRDGWANFDGDTGYERELASIWSRFRDAGVTNVVWLTTDVHFATGFVYHPFGESPWFSVYEFTAGPLSAMLLPTTAVDDTFHPERLYFYGPEKPVTTFDQATRFMNFGRIGIDERGVLSLSIVNGVGTEVVHHVLEPSPPHG
jgi:alkaline phosphatase D